MNCDVCVTIQPCAAHCICNTCGGSEGNPQGSVLLYHVDPGDKIPVMRLVSKYLYLWSHFPTQYHFFLLNLNMYQWV